MTVRQTIISKYGEPDAKYQAKYCEVWNIQKDFPWFPAKRIFINKDFKQKLHLAFINLERAGLHTEIKTFDGCYNDRSVRGKESKSLHAWCLAIDMNQATNGMVVKPFEQITVQDRMGSWSGQFIAIMKAAGIHFGGDFKNRPDPMHWGAYFG